MTISYSLTRNLLTNGANHYRAVVHFNESVELEDVIDRMIERGSTVTKADALAVLQEYHAAIANLVLQGFKVNTPGASYGASIKGNFTGQNDTFDPSRHHLDPSVSAGSDFRHAIREHGQVQKLEATSPSPNPTQYLDTNSGQSNTILTPGGMGHITGYRLKFDPADPNQGIFLTDTTNGNTPVRVEVVGKNLPSELMFLVPDTLTPGEYLLSVSALFGQNDVRAGTLKERLNVT